MSKFLNMGLTLEQVVAMATVNPAKIIRLLAEALNSRKSVRPRTCRFSRWSKAQWSLLTHATTSGKARYT